MSRDLVILEVQWGRARNLPRFIGPFAHLGEARDWARLNTNTTVGDQWMTVDLADPYYRSPVTEQDVKAMMSEPLADPDILGPTGARPGGG